MRALPLYAHEGTPCSIEEEVPLTFDGGCRRCGLHAKATTVCMPAALVGPEGAPVLYVLGQGPTQQEDRTGQPMIGATGQYLRGLINVSWPGQTIYDNALRCTPGRDKIKPAAIKACRPYGASVWQSSGASRVLLLGREAMTAFLGDGHPPLSVRRGYTYTSTGVPVFLLMNPAMAQRNRFVRGWFEEDLQWALTATPEPPPRTSTVLQVKTSADLEACLEDLAMAPWITWDCETYGAPHNHEFAILDIALTPGGQDYAYSFDRLAVEQYGKTLVHFLAQKRVRSGGHGIKFDTIAMRYVFGTWIKPAFDTMWWRRYFESDVELNLEDAQTQVGMTGGKGALSFVGETVIALRKEVKGPAKGKAAKYVAPGDYWHSHPNPTINRGERELAVERIRAGDEPKRYAYAGIPFDVRSCYNALDTVSTDRIYRNYAERTDAEAVRARSVWEKIGKGMNHALSVMEYNGIKPNREKIHELIALMDKDIQAIEGRIHAQFSAHGPFNFHSGSPDTGRLLFDVLKLPCKQFTPTGRRQCNAEVLEKLDHPVATDIVTWRQRQHFKSQYAEGMLTYIRDDGRIHPSIKGVGTGTGRPSCEDPNMFTLPRLDAADGSGKLCRDCFEAEDGWVFLEVDQSQVELRVAAMLSGDQRMIDVFLNDGDVHLEAAILTAPHLRIDPEEVKRLGKKHPHRSNTKAVVFGALYGEPEGALAKKLGISRAQAKRLQDMIFGHYHRLKEWCREQLRFSQRYGYTYTWWDGEWFRRRLLTDIGNTNQDDPAKDTAERSSWNTPIQGTACDYTNASLGAIQEWIEGEWEPGQEKTRSVLTVYDSILLEVRPDVLPYVARKVKGIMESWPTLGGMPLKGELKVGKAFGSLEDYELEDEHGAVQ